MRCPKCEHTEDKVIDSRSAGSGSVIRRRRMCLQCGNRFTTYEEIVRTQLRVTKRDGSCEPLDRAKLYGGIATACEKRPVSIATIEKVVDQMELSLQESGEKEIDASRIGEEVMSALQSIDEVAYVRFASVSRQFRDINEFMSELKDILAKGAE